jgi:leader peptidase (prepilin peptidase) / N-methyltransferase
MVDVPNWMVVATCALLGAAFGSFANVAVHRWPRRERVTSPPSQCSACGERIRVIDNIPVLSWLLLRGRCRSCGERISWGYPAVEILVAVIWALIAVVHGLAWELPALLLMGWALVVVTLIDLPHRIIPNALTYPLAPILLGLLTLAALMDGAWGDLRRAVIVGLALPVGMFVLSEIFRFARGQAGMGMGDVKLAVSLGLVLGYLGGWETVVALYATIIAAVLVAVVLMLAGKAKLASRIPFGPYLALGTLIAILAGEPLARLARGWLGFP